MKPNNCAIIFNPEIAQSPVVKEEIKSILCASGFECESFDINHLKKGVDIAFVIGGDGTILKTARFYAAEETAIFGIEA